MKLIQRTETLFEISMGYVKAFLVKGEKELILIDTGIPDQERAILKSIDDFGLDSSELKHILITHLHTDHVGSLYKLKQITGALVYAHEEETEAIEQGITLRACTPAPSLFSRIVVPMIQKKGLEKRIQGTRVDMKLEDGNILKLGGGIKVIHTPGHTKGHVSFLLQQEGGILIVGDAASGGRTPGYPMLFEDEEKGLKTIEHLGNFSFEKAFFAHGKGMTEKASQKFKNRF